MRKQYDFTEKLLRIRNGQIILIILFVSAAIGCGSANFIKSDIIKDTDQLYRINEGSKCGYMNKSGETVIKAEFDSCDNFSDGLAGILVGEKWGYINTKGEKVVEPMYLAVTPFSEGLAAVKTEVEDKEKRKNVTENTENSNVSIDTTESTVKPESESSKLKVWGFIDSTGKMVIEPKYSELGGAASSGAFSEGLAGVKPSYNSKFGFINKSGEMVIKPQFSGVAEFLEGIAPVSVGKAKSLKIGYINKNGVFVKNPSI